MTELRVLLLGPVLVQRDGLNVAIGSARQRTLLAALALQPGRVLARRELIDALWGEDPPDRAEANLQTHIWGLRKVLEPGSSARQATGSQRITTSGDGYALRLDKTECDVLNVEWLAQQAKADEAAGDLTAAATALEQALVLFRGTALGGVSGVVVERATPWLERLHLELREAYASLLLRLGRVDGAVRALAQIVRDEPLQEQSRGLYVQALYHAGRRTEALDELSHYRSTLRDSLGLDPSPAMVTLHQDVLNDALSPVPASSPAGAVAAPGASGRGRAAEAPDQAAAARRPASPRVPTRELPANPEWFTGRAEELSRLTHLFSEGGASPGAGPTVVLIDGPGGLGKSSLAVRAAHEVAAHYPDGQLYITARGFTPNRAPLTVGEVLRQIMPALGIPDENIPNDVDRQAALVRERLAARRVLIVLDDVRQAEVARAVIPRTGRSAVVLTSRKSFAGLVARDGVARLTIGPMPESEAVALLAYTIGQPNVDAEWTAQARDLARLCGYWPLALRVVAERVSDDSPAALAALVQEISAVTHRLQAMETDDDEMATVAAVLDWSYEALEPDEADLFRNLGDAGCSDLPTDAVGALAGLGPDEVRRLLVRLASQHMVERLVVPEATAAGTSLRWRMHDLIRLLAIEHAEREPLKTRRDALGRLLDWYVAHGTMARTALAPDLTGMLPGPGDVEPMPLPAALAWLEAERQNLLDLAATAVGLRDPACWLLLLVLTGYYINHGERTRWYALHEDALGVAADLGDERAALALRLNLAAAAMSEQRPHDAIADLRACLADPAASEQQRLMAKANLARCLVDVGDYAAADPLVDDVLADPATDRVPSIRNGLIDLSCKLAASRGDRAAARRLGQAALEAGASPVLRYRTMSSVADAWEQVGLLADSRDLSLAAAALARQLGGVGWMITRQTNAARLSEELGDVDAATQYLRDALTGLSELDPADEHGYKAELETLLDGLSADSSAPLGRASSGSDSEQPVATSADGSDAGDASRNARI